MYLAIQNFKYGLDTRRIELTTQPGAMAVLHNAVVNQGGEIVKRKAFPRTALPAGTFGLQSTAAGLVVFGSAAEPAGLPTGVIYVRCQHPDGSTAMTKVRTSTSFGTTAFCIAEFGDAVFTFYDGVMVDDLSPGRLALIYEDSTTLAAYFAALINAGGTHTATSSNGVLTIEGPEEQPFFVSTVNDSVCTEPVDPTPPDVDGVLITAMTLTVAAGPNGFNANLVYFDGGSGFTFSDPDVSPDDTQVFDLFSQAGATPLYGGNTLRIDDKASGIDDASDVLTLHVEYTGGATLDLVFGGDDVLAPPAYYEIDLVADGATDATITPTLLSNGVTPVSGSIPQGQFSVIAVAASGTNTITNVIVDEGGSDELELLDAPVVATNGDNPATAVLIAASIVAAANDFTATAVGQVVVIRATANYATWNGKSLIVKTTGKVAIGKAVLNFSLLPGSATLPTWTALLVDGGDILGSPVVGATDLTTSVADLAATINAFQATYLAVANGSTLFLSKYNTSSLDVPLSVTSVGSNFLVTGDEGGSGGSGGGYGLIHVVVNPTNAQLKWIQWSSAGSIMETAELVSIVNGGLPPYTYQWQKVSGADLDIQRINSSLIPLVPVTPSAALTKMQISIPDKFIFSLSQTWQLKVIDNLNQVGLSNSFNVYT